MNNEQDLIIIKKDTSGNCEYLNMRNIVKDIIDCKLQDEPFYVCNLEIILQKYLQWRELMPRVKPFYGKFNLTIICFSFN